MVEINLGIWMGLEPGFSQFICQTHTREFLVGVGVGGLVGVDHGVSLGELITWLVVIGNNHAHAQFFGPLHFLQRANTAIDSDE